MQIEDLKSQKYGGWQVYFPNLQSEIGNLQY